MKYIVTTSSGEQVQVESDLPYSLFCLKYPATHDIQPIVAEVAAEAPPPTPAPKRRSKATE